LRILTLTSLFPNAAQPNLGIFVYQRTAALATIPGNNVEVVAPLAWSPALAGGEKGRRLRAVPRVEQIGGITVHHPRYALVPKVSMPVHGWLMFRGALALARRLHRQSPFDCIDAHYVYPDGKAALLLGKELGLPVIVSARGSDMNLFPSFRLIRPQIRRTLREAAGRIAVSAALKQAMLEVAETDCDIRVIGNGVDVARFFPAAQHDARERLQIALDAKMIVSVAALLPVKGHARLLHAFRALTATFPWLHLYLVGEGTSRSELESLAASLGLQNAVHFAGACPNERLRDWYSAADVSCLASSREGWPNVVLESLACGTPVVATKVWGTPEILTSPELGVLVEQDEASIAAGLAAALRREWNREQLVGHARQREWSMVGREVDEYLREVLAAKG
jgi:glycosyltransferase involved in cell wall biosynthesis